MKFLNHHPQLPSPTFFLTPHLSKILKQIKVCNPRPRSLEVILKLVLLKSEMEKKKTIIVSIENFRAKQNKTLTLTTSKHNMFYLSQVSKSSAFFVILLHPS